MSTAQLIPPQSDLPAGGADWSLADAARYLGVSADAARKCAAQGLIPGHQANGEWRFSSSAVRAWQLGRGGRDTAGERLTQKELLLRWMGAWANDPPLTGEALAVDPTEAA
jgi:hypothetical protein